MSRMYNLSHYPSAIGVQIRDQYGVSQSKYVTGNKVLRILKAQGMSPELPEDLYAHH